MKRDITRTALGVVWLVAASGCLPRFPAPPATAADPAFDPVRFFGGQTAGEGTLRIRAAADRALRVQSVGRTEADGGFRLDQTITFGDGTTETRWWQLRREEGQRYSATLSDATGPVRADRHGNVFHLRYRLRRAVYMEQWLYLRPDGRAVDNRAQITAFGIPWARLSETILRVDSLR